MRSESFGQLFRKRQLSIAILLIATTLTIAALPTTAQSGVKEYNSTVYKLANIPVENARRHLVELGLSVDINMIEKAKTLIVTTDNPADTVKVASVLNLIDSKLPYEVTKLKFNAKTESVPAAAVINTAIEGIEIGSFSEPPTAGVPARAIIDINGKNLISIAPKGLIKHITSGLAALRSAKKFERKKLITQESTVKTTMAKNLDKAAAETAVLRLSETGRSTITAGKAKPKTKPAITDKSAGVDLSTVSPTLRQLKEAQRDLAEAFKNAESDSVKEFMGDKKNATEITKLAKSDHIDSGLLDVIRDLHKKNKEDIAKDAETKKSPKAAPEKKRPEKPRPRPGIHDKRTVPPGVKPAAPPVEKTDDKAPAAKATPSKISSSPKPDPRKTKPPQNDRMADALKALQMMEASKKAAPPTKPVNTYPGRTAPKNFVDPTKVTGTKPPVNNVTTTTKPATELSEEEVELSITLPTVVKISELLKLVGEILKLNYMFDPLLVKGEVTLYINDGKIKVSELYSLVESVLQFKGFVMTRTGKLVTVKRVSDAKGMDIVILGENESASKIGNVIVIKTFKVKHIDTATAQKTLTDMKLVISIQTIPEYGKLIVTGYSYRMDKIQQVLDMVDLPGKIKEFRYRMLAYLTPSALAPKLQVLAQELGTVSISVSSATTAAAPKYTSPSSNKPLSSRDRALAAARARAAAAAAAKSRNSKTSTSTIGAATSKSVYLDIDDRTNRILMIGLPESIDVVEGLIEILDVPRQGIKLIRQYKIEYVDASTILDILSELGVTAGGARPITTPSPRSPRTPAPATLTRGANSGDGPKVSLLMGTNSLLVNATHEKHEEIMAIIAHVDVENPDGRMIKKYEIEHVDTQEVINTLTEMGIISSQSSRSSNRTNTGRPTPGRPTTGRPTTTPTPSYSSSFSEPLVDEPQIAVLETTNSLLVNATAKQHASIVMVIELVDDELTENSTPYVIYPLENQDPLELKPILDELVNSTIAKMQGKSGSTTGLTTNKIITTPKSSGIKDEDEKVTIVSDPKTYSLIVHASKKNQLWIGKLITELDAYRPQVLLDVTLVEISKNDMFEYDLEMVSAIPNLANTSGVLSSIAGTTTDLISGALASAGDRNSFREGSFNSTNGGRGFYADGHINALMKLMQTKGYGRVLASPKILVNDNEKGSIDTSDTTYVTRTDTSNISGNSIVSNTTTRDDAYSAGITLSIEPHISKGENLRLIIDLVRSDFGQITGDKPPDTAKNTINTTVTVPNNATIILGGMERLNQSKSGTGIPILSQIPIIGGLFKTSSKSDIQKKLYIFVKAHILRPGSGEGMTDIKRISDRNRAEFEKMETEMHEYQDWPGIKSQPMDPIHILESDEYVEPLKADDPRKYIDIKLD